MGNSGKPGTCPQCKFHYNNLLDHITKRHADERFTQDDVSHAGLVACQCGRVLLNRSGIGQHQLRYGCLRRDEEREARLGAEERQKAATVLSRLSTAPSSNGTSTTHNIGLPINPASQNLSTALAARQARTASSQASSSLTALSTTPPIRLSHPPRIQSSPLTSIHSSTPSQPSVSWHGSASVHNAFRHLQLDVEFEDIEEEEEPVEDRPPRDPSVDHARLLGAKLGLESTSGDRDDGLGQVDVGMVVEVVEDGPDPVGDRMVVEVEEVVPVPEGDGMVVEEGDGIPGSVGDRFGEEDWELEYDLDDQREQEALENAGN